MILSRPTRCFGARPDGTQLLTLRLPDDRGYLNAFPLADTPEAVSPPVRGLVS